MTELDRVSLIERWTCHACGKPLASADEPHSPADCDKYRENPVREEVESLRQQLRGAVGALTDVRAYAEALKRSPERRAQRIGADLMGLLASHEWGQ